MVVAAAAAGGGVSGVALCRRAPRAEPAICEPIRECKHLGHAFEVGARAQPLFLQVCIPLDATYGTPHANVGTGGDADCDTAIDGHSWSYGALKHGSG